MVDIASSIKKVEDEDGNEYDVWKLQQLGDHLKSRFSQYQKDRTEQEKQWLQDLYQFLGKYDPEIENNLDANRSRAYPKVTRTKIMVIVARLMNLLFPQSDKSWEISPSRVPNLEEDELQQAYDEWRNQNPEAEVTEQQLEQIIEDFAREAARRLEKHIESQLADAMGSAAESDNSDFVYLCRRVIMSAAIYGMGILKGPMTVSYNRHRFELIPGSEPAVVSEESYRPYFEPVEVWDYYPDLNARSFEQMDGQFEDHVYAKHQLQALARRPDFFGDLIRQYMEINPSGSGDKRSHENQLESLNNRKSKKTKEGKKFRVQEYWGTVDKEMVEETGLEIPDKYEEAQVIPVTVWIIDNVPIKLAINPLPEAANIYHTFVFDDSPPNLCGGSMCQIVRDSQMAISSSARMLIDNASVTCGPNVEIDLSKLRPGQDVATIGAFRAYYTDGRRNASGHRAVNSISFDSHINELLSVMNQFMQFSDMETFVGGHGDEAANTPGEALRTSAGASMVLGNAALPFRDIVRNFDQFTVSVLNSLVAWNDIFNDQLDVVGDLRPVAKGSTSLIAKEVQAYTLDNLSQTMSEEEWDYIDPQKLVKQRLMARDIPELDVMVTDAEAAERRQQRQQREQQQEQMQQQQFEAELEEQRTDALKNAAQAKKHLDNADASSIQALIKMLETVQQGAGQLQQGQQEAEQQQMEQLQQMMGGQQSGLPGDGQQGGGEGQ